MSIGTGTVFQNPHDQRSDHEVYAGDLRLTERTVRLFAREAKPALQVPDEEARTAGRTAAEAAARHA